MRVHETQQPALVSYGSNSNIAPTDLNVEGSVYFVLSQDVEAKIEEWILKDEFFGP